MPCISVDELADKQQGRQQHSGYSLTHLLTYLLNCSVSHLWSSSQLAPPIDYYPKWNSFSPILRSTPIGDDFRLLVTSRRLPVAAVDRQVKEGDARCPNCRSSSVDFRSSRRHLDHARTTRQWRSTNLEDVKILEALCRRRHTGRHIFRNTERHIDMPTCYITDRQTSLHIWCDVVIVLKTAKGQGAPIPVFIILVQTTHAASRPLGLRPRCLALRPRYLCVYAIMGVA